MKYSVILFCASKFTCSIEIRITSVFGLDNDLTSNTTRSLDLESLLGGAWGTAQSDSETDTQGIRHIRSQLEGLEHMYGEVLRVWMASDFSVHVTPTNSFHFIFCHFPLKMLGTRGNVAGRLHESLRPRGAGIRRRHGSLSSLPSSSISGRPIRDRRRIDERRKIKDVKVHIYTTMPSCLFNSCIKYRIKQIIFIFCSNRE